jgi:plasmid stabilization system protein ParE
MERVVEYGEYIAQDNPKAAAEWIEGVLEEVERLKDYPEQGRNVLEVKRSDVREIFFKGHRIVYRFEARHIFILTVRHTRRLLDLKEL